MGLDMNVYQKLNIPTSTAPAQDLDQLARTVTDIYKNSSTSDIDSGDTQSKTTAKPDSDSSGGMMKSLMALIAGLLTGDTAAVSKGLVDCEKAAQEADAKGGGTTAGGTTAGGTTAGGTTAGGTTAGGTTATDDKPAKPADPNAVNSPEEAAMALRDDKAVWDNAEGKINRSKGLLTRTYIGHIAENKDGKFSEKTVNAAKYMMQNRVAFDKADKGNDSEDCDDHISKKDLETLVPAGAGPAADENGMDMHKAAQTLRNDGTVWDNVEGKVNRKKGLITREYMQHIAENQGGKFSPEAVAAAKYTMAHQYVFDKFDKGSDSDDLDEHISKKDLEANL